LSFKLVPCPFFPLAACGNVNHNAGYDLEEMMMRLRTITSIIWMLGTEDRTLGVLGNGLIRANHATHTGPSFLLELKNGGHYSFTDVFKFSQIFGDGVGSGQRRDTNEPFEFTSMERTYQIINSYSVAFLGYFLKGQKEYWTFLSENHWPDALLWDVRNPPKSSF
jgi:hypothetical protein